MEGRIAGKAKVVSPAGRLRRTGHYLHNGEDGRRLRRNRPRRRSVSDVGSTGGLAFLKSKGPPPAKWSRQTQQLIQKLLMNLLQIATVPT